VEYLEISAYTLHFCHIIGWENNLWESIFETIRPIRSTDAPCLVVANPSGDGQTKDELD